tara:strand:- start:248 stop:1186 length:939 start_codon:yes stop_codon:yes gene_type:complete
MPFNPGNVRRLNALGGKRPQATGIAILPKNGDRVLNTSEGSVNNYGGNKKMGLYSNVGMSYQFQNLNLTGARINGNMPYFWGGMNAITKPSRKTKNMITVKMIDDGDSNTANSGTKGFVSAPYWNPVSTFLDTNNLLDDSYVAPSMGSVNSRQVLAVRDAKIIAIEMWRGDGGSLGPVHSANHPGIHIWTEKPCNFTSVTIRQGGVQCRLAITAVYSKASPPGTDATGAIGNFNNAVSNALAQANVTFPATATIAAARQVPDNDAVRVYWLKFPAASTTNGANARLIFPATSGTNAKLADQDIYRDMAIYFE